MSEDQLRKRMRFEEVPTKYDVFIGEYLLGEIKFNVGHQAWAFIPRVGQIEIYPDELAKINEFVMDITNTTSCQERSLTRKDLIASHVRPQDLDLYEDLDIVRPVHPLPDEPIEGRK